MAVADELFEHVEGKAEGSPTVWAIVFLSLLSS